jgi:hypothetical protein
MVEYDEHFKHKTSNEFEFHLFQKGPNLVQLSNVDNTFIGCKVFAHKLAICLPKIFLNKCNRLLLRTHIFLISLPNAAILVGISASRDGAQVLFRLQDQLTLPS